jgi:hypothetical protein
LGVGGTGGGLFGLGPALTKGQELIEHDSDQGCQGYAFEAEVAYVEGEGCARFGSDVDSADVDAAARRDSA